MDVNDLPRSYGSRKRVTWLPDADEPRFDRASAPVEVNESEDGTTITGVAARVHEPGDPLRYPSGPEYRDSDGLRQLADGLAGKPVTLEHPPGLLSNGAPGRIVGTVKRAWLDGDRARVEIELADRGVLPVINAGARELSVGYRAVLDAHRYQRSIDVDHLALVESARCGATCKLDHDHDVEHHDCSCDAACEPCALQRARADAAARSIADVRTQLWAMRHAAMEHGIETPRAREDSARDEMINRIREASRIRKGSK